MNHPFLLFLAIYLTIGLAGLVDERKQWPPGAYTAGSYFAALLTLVLIIFLYYRSCT